MQILLPSYIAIKHAAHMTNWTWIPTLDSSPSSTQPAHWKKEKTRLFLSMTMSFLWFLKPALLLLLLHMLACGWQCNITLIGMGVRNRGRAHEDHDCVSFQPATVLSQETKINRNRGLLTAKSTNASCTAIREGDTQSQILINSC